MSNVDCYYFWVLWVGWFGVFFGGVGSVVWGVVCGVRIIGWKFVVLLVGCGWIRFVGCVFGWVGWWLGFWYFWVSGGVCWVWLWCCVWVVCVVGDC